MEELQENLKQVGYAIDVDGYFGASTKSVVVSFQSTYGLPADGIVGQPTFNKLVTAVENHGGTFWY